MAADWLSQLVPLAAVQCLDWAGCDSAVSTHTLAEEIHWSEVSVVTTAAAGWAFSPLLAKLLSNLKLLDLEKDKKVKNGQILFVICNVKS